MDRTHSIRQWGVVFRFSVLLAPIALISACSNQGVRESDVPTRIIPSSFTSRPGDVRGSVEARPRAASSTSSSSVPSDQLTRHFALRIGQLELDKSDYTPVENQTSFGIEFSDELPGKWLGYEIGMKGSYDSDEVGAFDVNASTIELYGGAVKYLGSWHVRPFVGAGLSIINARVEVESIGFFGLSDSEDDTSLAGYIHGGAVWNITKKVFVGIDGRVLFGSDLSFNGFDTDADYEEIALIFGVSY